MLNIVSDGESDNENDESFTESDFEDPLETDAVLTEVNSSIEADLSARSLVHGLILQDCIDQHTQSDNFMHMRDSDAVHFKGLLIDTGASRSSVMSVEQYASYCREHLVSVQIDTSDQKTLHGVGPTTTTLGGATIVLPMPSLRIQTPTIFHIVEAPLPSVLCLRDLQNMGVELSIQKECLLLHGKRHPLTPVNCLLYYRWDPQDVVLYTEGELRKLHRTFGHPSVTALSNLLRRARPDSESVVLGLERIAKHYETSQNNSLKPRRFKLTTGCEEPRFNHTVSIDVFYIDGKPIFHCVDEAAHYAAALFLPFMSSADVWKSLLKCWSRVYLWYSGLLSSRAT